MWRAWRGEEGRVRNLKLKSPCLFCRTMRYNATRQKARRRHDGQWMVKPLGDNRNKHRAGGVNTISGRAADAENPPLWSVVPSQMTLNSSPLFSNCLPTLTIQQETAWQTFTPTPLCNKNCCECSRKRDWSAYTSQRKQNIHLAI